MPRDITDAAVRDDDICRRDVTPRRARAAMLRYAMFAAASLPKICYARARYTFDQDTFCRDRVTIARYVTSCRAMSYAMLMRDARYAASYGESAR